MTSSPLANALYSAFKLEGLSILADPILYNVLWDLGGFEDSCELRKAFKVFVSAGYSKRLYTSIKKYKPLTAKSNNEKIALQVNREEVVFENTSITNPEVSKYLFDSIREALDVVEQANTEHQNIDVSSKKNIMILLCSLSIIAAVVVAVLLYTREKQAPIYTCCLGVESIEGNYSIRVNSESGEFFFTGKITSEDKGVYILMVITDYGPQRITILYNPGSSGLYSPELGKGEIIINDVTSSITLSFNKESTSWKLTK